MLDEFVRFSNQEPFVTSTHFWDPDNGDETDTRLDGQFWGIDFLIVAENAYKKIRLYVDGFRLQTNWSVIYDHLGREWKFYNYNEQRVDFMFSYFDIINLYKEGRVVMQNDLGKMGGHTYSRGTHIFLSEADRGKIVWELLGRIAHLLGDMSVPAHAHQDAHGSDDPGVHQDSYENWFYNSSNYHWNASLINMYYGPNSVLKPYFHGIDPIHYLAFTTAQISGYFGSNGPYSGDGNSNIGGSHSSDEWNYVNENTSNLLTYIDGYNICVMRTNDNEYTQNIKEYIRDKTVPQAIRSISGLLYWFACETGMLPHPRFKVPVISGYPISKGGTGTLPDIKLFGEVEKPIPDLPYVWKPKYFSFTWAGTQWGWIEDVNKFYANTLDENVTLPRTYKVKVVYNKWDGGVVTDHLEGPISTNSITFCPSPVDPIVANTTSGEATAYSNGRKIVIDNTGNLHVTYTSGDTIYYTTSGDEGETWTPAQVVGFGSNPAIGLRSSGAKSGSLLPSICYVSGSGLLLAEKQEAGVWGQPQTVYQGQPDETISYLSFEIDRNSNSQYAGWVSSIPSGSLVNIAQGSPGGGTLAPTPIDQGGQTTFKSPSLALDRFGNLTAAWSRDGVVRYKEGSESTIELSAPGKYCIHPIVETYGDRVSVVWQEQIESSKGLEPGRYGIVKREKTEYGWGPEELISYPDPSGDAQYPVVAAHGQYIFAAHHGDGNYDIHRRGEYANGWDIHIRNISCLSGGISGYPCVAFSNKWPEHALYVLWTETFPESGKAITKPLVKAFKDVIQPVPSFEVYPRTEQASTYCTQRAGALCYGVGAYNTVDYHPQELKYRFTGLNKVNRYKIKSVFYRSTGSGSSPSSNWILMPKCDNVTFGTVHLPDTTVVVLEREIPKNCLRDGEVEITVRRVKGDYAVCAGLEIIEYTTGDNYEGGGTQSAESEPLPASYCYELMPCTPNPFNRTTTIRYQLARPGLASLKVYNILGQVVKVLKNGHHQAGLHQASWDGKDEKGRQAASGVYYYDLTSGNYHEMKRLVLVR